MDTVLLVHSRVTAVWVRIATSIRASAMLTALPILTAQSTRTAIKLDIVKHRHARTRSDALWRHLVSTVSVTSALMGTRKPKAVVNQAKSALHKLSLLMISYLANATQKSAIPFQV